MSSIRQRKNHLDNLSGSGDIQDWSNQKFDKI